MTDEEKRKLYLKTVNEHLGYVRDMCNLMGIPELGKLHDLSKFDPEEFEIYHWADGKRSPHDNARAALGYSPSWIYHKAKNPHHWEFWTDFSSATPNDDGTFTIICTCVKMPYERVIEMFCDFVAAGKAYEKGKWTPKNPYNYWLEKCKNQRAMHVDSEHLLEILLKKLSDLNDLDKFVAWYNQEKEKLMKQYEKGALD